MSEEKNVSDEPDEFKSLRESVYTSVKALIRDQIDAFDKTVGTRRRHACINAGEVLWWLGTGLILANRKSANLVEIMEPEMKAILKHFNEYLDEFIVRRI